MTIPDWWEFAILSLGSYRVWRLVAVDTITEPIRDRVFRMAEYQAGREDRYRFKLDELVTCPWCLGFWIAIAVWGVWQLVPHATLVVLTPFALNAAVGYMGKAD